MSASASLEVMVLDRTDLNSDVMAITLAPKSGSALPVFEAGAHVDVQVAGGITRQYSLCNDPKSENVYRLGILKDRNSRGGSLTLHQSTKAGQSLVISQPKNNFPLDSAAKFSLLVGAGIGITPMISMAYALYAEGKDFRLHYCVTGPEAAAFSEELMGTPFAEKVHLNFDMSEEAPAFDPSQNIPAADSGTHLYTCGPTGFMDWVLDAARQKGYESTNLHKEDFGADVDVSGSAFEVEASASGKIFQVAEGQTIAQALAENGIAVEVSCEEGVCGTCLTDVIEGEVDHRDIFLTDEEKDQGDLILVCCSRAKSQKLVLDI